MGGYIGARAGTISATVANVQDVTATDTTPEVTIVNSTHEDTDGGREGKVIFKGQQSGGEETTLAEIQGSHDGTADDEKGDLIFKTNDGSDGASPTERLRIDSDGSIITATLGTDNLKFGEGAGISIASGGNENILIGKDAGTALNTGDRNVSIGHTAFDSATDQTNNVAIGYNALSSVTASGDTLCTAVGSKALEANTAGYHNTAVGYGAQDANTHGIRNVSVGRDSLGADTKGSYSVAIGDSALAAQNNTSATDAFNTAVGPSAGSLITTGTKNTIIGGFNGNQHGWDMRTKSSASVISDGDGELQGLFYGVGNMTMKLSRVTTDGMNYHPNIMAAAENLSADFTTGAGIATIVTADYVLPYQRQVMLQVTVGTSAYWNHVTYMLTCNYSNVSATTLASVFNGSGNLTINSIGISFTGAYNSRKVAITLTPNGSTSLSNMDCYLHYAPSTYCGSSDLYV